MNRLVQVFLWLTFSASISASLDVQKNSFEHSLGLRLMGDNAAYVFDVPDAVYQNVYYAHLSDVRIVNSTGDFVPMRLVLNSDMNEHEYSQTSLPIFTLTKVLSTPISTKQTRTTQSGNSEDFSVETSKSMRSFLENHEIQDDSVIYIDASILKNQKIEKLSLNWKFELQGNRIFYVKLSGSNDLSNWQTIKSHHKLLEIKSGDKTILENNIEINQSAFLYYQLTFKDKIKPEITKVNAHLLSQFAKGSNQWKPIDKITLNNENELLVDTGGYYSIESFKLLFNQKNTITDVTFYSRNNPKSQWKYAGSGSVYSINMDGKLNSKNSVKVRASQNRYWKIVLDDNIKNDSIKTVEFAWRNHQIEFLAQGQAPFNLLFAKKSQSMRPSSDWYNKLPEGISFSNQLIINEYKAANKLVVQHPKIDVNNAKFIFWLILTLVIVLLGFMAYKLVRENDNPS